MFGVGLVKRIKSFGEKEEADGEQKCVVREFTIDEVTETMIWFEIPPTYSGERTMTYPSPIHHTEYDENVKELVEEILECDEDGALYRIEFVESDSKDFSWLLNDGERIGNVWE